MKHIYDKSVKIGINEINERFDWMRDGVAPPCPRGYITITCLHKSAGWSVGTNGQNHSAKNKINISGGTQYFTFGHIAKHDKSAPILPN